MKGRQPASVSMLFHVYMLLLLSGAFLLLWQEMVGVPPDPVDGSAMTRGLLLLGYAVTLPVLLRRPVRGLRRAMSAPLIWVLLALAFLSVFWSSAPELTFRRSVAALLTAMYGLVVVQQFTLRAFLRLWGSVLLLSIAASLVCIALVPSWGIMGSPHPGAWRGVFAHKNGLGLFSALGLLVFAYLWNSSHGKGRALWGSAFAASAVALVGSRSATSMAVVAVVGAAEVVVVSGPLNRKTRVAGAAALAVAAGLTIYWVATHYALVLEALGKDVTLTGRVQLWQMLLSMAAERPWLGWGFGAFWRGLSGPSAQVWSWFPEWLPQHAHNGYIQILLDLGIVGLAPGILALLAPGLRMLPRLWSRKPTPELGFMIALWLFLVGHGLAESSFLRQNSLAWVLLVLLSLSEEWLGESPRSVVAWRSSGWLVDSGSFPP